MMQIDFIDLIGKATLRDIYKCHLTSAKRKLISKNFLTAVFCSRKYRGTEIFYTITSTSFGDRTLWVEADIYMCSAVFKQQQRNLSKGLLRPFAIFQQRFRNLDAASRTTIDFYVSTVKKVSADLLAHPEQFPRRNSLAVLTEVHLGPCIYAGLTLKCSHKLDPFATKSWKNLSVRMSLVLGETAKIKRQNRTKSLSSWLLLAASLYGIVNKLFFFFQTSMRWST